MLFEDPYKNINGHKVTEQSTAESIDPLGRGHIKQSFIKAPIQTKTPVQGSSNPADASKALGAFFVFFFFAIITVMTFTYVKDMISGHSSFYAPSTRTPNNKEEYIDHSANIDASRLTSTDYKISEIGKAFSIERGNLTFQETQNIYAVSLSNSDPLDYGYTSELELAVKNHPMDLLTLEIGTKDTWPTSDYYEECKKDVSRCIVIEPLAENNFDLLINDYMGTISKKGTYKLYRHLKSGDILISYKPANPDQPTKDSVAIIKEASSAITNIKENDAYAMDMATRIRLPFGYYLSSYYDVDEIDFKEERLTFTTHRNDLQYNYTIDIWLNGNDNNAYTEVQQFKYLNSTLREAPDGRAYLKIVDDAGYIYEVAIHYDVITPTNTNKANKTTYYIKSPERLKEIFDEIYANTTSR